MPELSVVVPVHVVTPAVAEQVIVGGGAADAATGTAAPTRAPITPTQSSRRLGKGPLMASFSPLFAMLYWIQRV